MIEKAMIEIDITNRLVEQSLNIMKSNIDRTIRLKELKEHVDVLIKKGEALKPLIGGIYGK